MNELSKLFHMSLNEMLESDLWFIINRMTRTVYIDGTEINGLDDAGYVVIIYHPADNKPLIISIFGKVDTSTIDQSGFEHTYTSEDGDSSTYVRSATKTVLLDEQED